VLEADEDVAVPGRPGVARDEPGRAEAQHRKVCGQQRRRDARGDGGRPPDAPKERPTEPQQRRAVAVQRRAVVARNEREAARVLDRLLDPCAGPGDLVVGVRGETGVVGFVDGEQEVPDDLDDRGERAERRARPRSGEPVELAVCAAVSWNVRGVAPVPAAVPVVTMVPSSRVTTTVTVPGSWIVAP
jgi:hypothetical protein